MLKALIYSVVSYAYRYMPKTYEHSVITISGAIKASSLAARRGVCADENAARLLRGCGLHGFAQ